MSAGSSPYVIIDPAFLGDVVFDGPLVSALKRREPQAEIALVVRPAAKAIAQRIAGVGRVHVFDKRGRDRGVGGLRRVAAELSASSYQTALIPHPSPRSSLLAALARIPNRVGFASTSLARLFLTRAVQPTRETYVGSRLDLIGEDSKDADLLSGTMPRTDPPGGSAHKRIGLALGSEWATKRWPAEQAVALLEGLNVERSRLVLLGSDAERSLFAPLVAAAAADQIEDRIGGSVDDLIRAIESCDLVIGPDTGPTHIARAIGIPVIALFGPTPEARHRFADTDKVLSVADLECRPCSDHGPRVCPLGHHRCMRELAGGDVLVALGEIG